jgi:hypothetical protein
MKINNAFDKIGKPFKLKIVSYSNPAQNKTKSYLSALIFEIGFILFY